MGHSLLLSRAALGLCVLHFISEVFTELCFGKNIHFTLNSSYKKQNIKILLLEPSPLLRTPADFRIWRAENYQLKDLRQCSGSTLYTLVCLCLGV